MKKHILILACLFTALLCFAQEAPKPAAKPATFKVPQSQVRNASAASRIRKMANELRAHYDANKNGTLEAAEYAELKRDMEAAERLARTYRFYNTVISKLDTDNNLVISNEEMERLRAVQLENIRQNQERRKQKTADKKEAAPVKKDAAPVKAAPAAPVPPAPPAK